MRLTRWSILFVLLPSPLPFTYPHGSLTLTKLESKFDLNYLFIYIWESKFIMLVTYLSRIQDQNFLAKQGGGHLSSLAFEWRASNKTKVGIYIYICLIGKKKWRKNMQQSGIFEESEALLISECVCVCLQQLPPPPTTRLITLSFDNMDFHMWKSVHWILCTWGSLLITIIQNKNCYHIIKKKFLI